MEEIAQNKKQTQRPQLLTILAILSFIGSGLALMSNLMSIFLYSTIVNVDITELTDVYAQIFDEAVLESTLAMFREAGRLFFALGALASAGSLYGVYKMWNLQKEGFHYYAISQITSLILPLVFVSPQLPVFSSLLLTALFLLLYYRSFKMIEDGK